MTREFDDKAREFLRHNLYQFNFRYMNTPVKDMRIIQVTVGYARPFIASYHYSHTMPDSTKEVFAGYFNDSLAGLIVFGMGCNKNQFTCLLPGLKNGQYRELTRLWSPDVMPRNTESKLISGALRLLPDSVRLIVSFADSSHQHKGYVYQATNFFYCGMTSCAKLLVDKDGFEFHPRLLGMYRKRHPEYTGLDKEELCNILGYVWKEGGRKHRYVYLLNKRDRNWFLKNGDIQEYPK